MDKPICVKLTDEVLCHCGHSASLKSFKFVSWLKFREPGCEHAVSGYYYCQCQANLPLPSGRIKLSILVGIKKIRKMEERLKNGYAKPIAFRQGGSRKEPRIILSFPERDRILQSSQAETLQLVVSS